MITAQEIYFFSAGFGVALFLHFITEAAYSFVFAFNR